MADETHPRPDPYPDELKALHAALAKAQGEFPSIPKSATVDTGTYTFSYAPLEVIIDAVRPVLAKHGLAVIQRLEAAGGNPSIRTELLHADGGTIAASFPIGDTQGTIQQLGSKLTYLRRYALCSMLCIAAEEDTDGHSPVSAAQAPTQSRAPTGTGDASERPGGEASPFQQPDLLRGDVVEDLTAKQRGMIFALKTKLTDAGLFDDDQFKAQLFMAFGVDSVTGLTKAQATELIKRLKAKEDKLEGGDAQ